MRPARRLGIVPARLASTRLPQKLLLAETGRALVVHTYEAAREAGVFDEVVVATDSEAIAAVCRAAGAPVVMTSPECPSGTDRVREASDALGLDDETVVVNVQGDEPEVSRDVLEAVLGQVTSSAVATYAFPITADEALEPNLVKVVRAASGLALYFSRARVPFARDTDAITSTTWLGHAGIYAFSAGMLRSLTRWSPSPLERLEKLEQLRWLEAGAQIAVAVGKRPGIGIDTRVDYDRFKARLATVARLEGTR